MPYSLRLGGLARQFGLLLLWLLGAALPAAAVHLDGGELSYRFLDDRGPADKPWRYEITARVYFNPLTDPVVYPLGFNFYDSNVPYGNPPVVASAQRLSSTPLPLPVLPGCGPPNQPVSVGLYVITVELPALPNGFLVSCSTGDRITGITNLKNSVKGAMLLTMYLAPGTIPNSSPVFATLPVSLICLGTPTLVSNTAYDAEGDELEYTFGTPTAVYGLEYAPGYSATQPFGASGTADLNVRTGQATYRSLTQGIFQLAVDVKEFRVVNGQRWQLSYVHRDMQVVVRTCGAPPGQAPYFTPASLAQRAFTLREGEALNFDVTALDPDGDPLTLTASSVLLDGPGGLDATFAGQSGGSLAANPVGQAVVRGVGTVSGTFRLAGCGLTRPGPYEVTLTAADEACNSQSVVATFSITVTRPAFVGTLRGPSPVCAQSVATYSVQNSPYRTFKWSAAGGQVLGSDTGPTADVLWGPAGRGTVYAGGITATGCPSQAGAYPVSIGPGLGVSGPEAYCLTAASGLRYTVTGPPGAYQWTITDGAILQGQGTSEVLVEVLPGATATLQVGSPALSACTTTLRIRPDDDCLAFYNIITPNGDTYNDVFVIKNLERYPRTALTIFNRWGRQVYHTDNYANTYDGAGTSAGLYYYRCRLADGTTYKGWFEVVR